GPFHLSTFGTTPIPPEGAHTPSRTRKEDTGRRASTTYGDLERPQVRIRCAAQPLSHTSDGRPGPWPPRAAARFVADANYVQSWTAPYHTARGRAGGVSLWRGRAQHGSAGA